MPHFISICVRRNIPPRRWRCRGSTFRLKICFASSSRSPTHRRGGRSMPIHIAAVNACKNASWPVLLLSNLILTPEGTLELDRCFSADAHFRVCRRFSENIIFSVFGEQMKSRLDPSFWRLITSVEGVSIRSKCTWFHVLTLSLFFCISKKCIVMRRHL